jgi:hypothetical protein
MIRRIFRQPGIPAHPSFRGIPGLPRRLAAPPPADIRSNHVHVQQRRTQERLHCRRKSCDIGQTLSPKRTPFFFIGDYSSYFNLFPLLFAPGINLVYFLKEDHKDALYP